MFRFWPALVASACMSATSSRTRATAGGQTSSMSAIVRSGVFAIEFSTRQCACVA